jgi:hypothetical protein
MILFLRFFYWMLKLFRQCDIYFFHFIICYEKKQLSCNCEKKYQLIFRMHNRDPPPQGVENRNILLWFKCVLTALNVNCIILFDKVLRFIWGIELCHIWFFFIYFFNRTLFLTTTNVMIYSSIFLRNLLLL